MIFVTVVLSFVFYIHGSNIIHYFCERDPFTSPLILLFLLLFRVFTVKETPGTGMALKYPYISLINILYIIHDVYVWLLLEFRNAK